MTPGQPCQVSIPNEGVFVLRVEGPGEGVTPTSIELKRMGPALQRSGLLHLRIPPVFEEPMLTARIPPGSAISSPVAGPISVEKIQDAGPDGNRMVVVVMGDGYTAANLSAELFREHTATIWLGFTLKKFWREYEPSINVYRIDVESNQEGADLPGAVPPLYVDTYFDATFWKNNIERLLALSNAGRTRAFQAADAMVGVGVWDEILVAVNSTKYGGSGGQISVTSVNSVAPEIAIHEIGHSFAGLADEYSYSDGQTVTNDNEPNVDFDFSGPGLKWLAWVEAGTPLPTPDDWQYELKVGAFEGAKYTSTNIYRPWRNCMMRGLGYEFCPVCTEAHIFWLFTLTDLIDGCSPSDSSVVLDQSQQTFSVATQALAPLAFQWTLNGEIVAGANENAFSVNATELPAQSTLSVRVEHPSANLRLGEIVESRAWTIEVPTASVQDWPVYP